MSSINLFTYTTMKTLIDSYKRRPRPELFIAFILMGGILVAGCSAVGAGGGLLIDSSNRKKADLIQYESQKIVLRYNHGQKVRGIYRGLEYTPQYAHAELHASDSLPIKRQIVFPKIGEQISLTLHDDTTAREGRFSGLAKSGNHYLLMLNPGPDQPLLKFPFENVNRIATDNGTILTAFPEPGRFNLLYETDGEFRRVSLHAVRNVNYRPTNHALTLGALGLIVDVIMVIQMSQAVSDISLYWQ